MQQEIRRDWAIKEIQDLYNQPLLELVYRAATVHRKYNDTAEVQVCTLLSIKQVGAAKIALTARRPQGTALVLMYMP